MRRRHNGYEAIGTALQNYDGSECFTYREAVERIERLDGMKHGITRDRHNPEFYNVWVYPDDDTSVPFKSRRVYRGEDSL